jgi:hypothetical protein
MKEESIVQMKKTRSEREPEILSIIQSKIPDYHKYFAPIEKIQKLSRMTLNNNYFKTENEESKELVQVTRRRIGKQTLQKRIDDLFEKLPGSAPEKVEEYYKHLEEGLMKLANNARVVHFNVRPENIMYDDSQYCPILTNFGEAFVLDDLYSDENMKTVFKHPLPEYVPIEAKLISAIVKNENWKTRQVKIDELESQPLKDFRDDSQYEKTEPSIMTDKWVRYIRKFEGTKGEKVVNELLENWNTWDIGMVNPSEKHVPGKPYKMDTNVSFSQ